MSKPKSIEEGENEMIMSTLYWICTNFVNPDNYGYDSCKAFQTMFGQAIVD